MRTGFLIQPFDGSSFDELGDSVLAPALEDAGVTPYRVDRDPHVAIPIEQVEWGIQRADVCVAEITLDNPNVWLEVGLARAAGHDPVLVCQRGSRTHLPYNVQHRSVILYDPTSPAGLAEFRERVCARVKAVLTERREQAEFEREMNDRFSPGGRLNDPVFVLLLFLCLASGGIAAILYGAVRDRDRLLAEVTEQANVLLRPTGKEIRWAIPLDPEGKTGMDQVFSRSPNPRPD